MYSALDYSKISSAIFLDIASAFDTVDHGTLLRKLLIFGINKSSLNWFKSYLINRKQAVKINAVNSNMCKIEYRLSQVSVFILHIYEICDVNNIEGSIVKYVDDTCLLLSHNTWKGV